MKTQKKGQRILKAIRKIVSQKSISMILLLAIAITPIMASVSSVTVFADGISENFIPSIPDGDEGTFLPETESTLSPFSLADFSAAKILNVNFAGSPTVIASVSSLDEIDKLIADNDISLFCYAFAHELY